MPAQPTALAVLAALACACAGEGRVVCVEECGGDCVPPCPDELVRDAETCECEPACGRGYEWSEGDCIPIGGGSDVDADSDTGTGECDEWEPWTCDHGECDDEGDCFGLYGDPPSWDYCWECEDNECITWVCCGNYCE